MYFGDYLDTKHPPVDEYYFNSHNCTFSNQQTIIGKLNIETTLTIQCGKWPPTDYPFSKYVLLISFFALKVDYFYL